MDLATVAAFTWADAAGFFGLLVFVMFLIGATMSFFLQLRKTKLRAAQEEDLRQVVRRYEHFAENTLDVQQRVAADMSELRSRMALVEKILRTVDGE
jgi:cbb3-type cytochrome oxidase subunit 3